MNIGIISSQITTVTTSTPVLGIHYVSTPVLQRGTYITFRNTDESAAEALVSSTSPPTGSFGSVPSNTTVNTLKISSNSSYPSGSIYYGQAKVTGKNDSLIVSYTT